MDSIKSFECREGFAEVGTKYGKIRGFRQNGVYTFRGVEYARAERFMSAREPECWEGVKTALDYGFVCPNMQAPSFVNDHQLPHRFWITGEDCLNLNIWTMSLDETAKKPVMVWLHGGGYVAGNASDFEIYEGSGLAYYGDVVSVTVNHRLNVLGCLDLSEYGDEFSSSGNIIMQDVVMALRWIRDNISSFGGDPGNVTIYGQSGGGGKVTTLMQMPSADGLYHRAIIQSGILRFTGPVENASMRITREAAREYADKLVSRCNGVENLRSMPVRDLMEICAQLFGRNMFWAPVPGAGDYPGDIGQTGGFRKETKDIPTMIGNCLCEFPRYHSGRDKSSMTEEEKLCALTEVYGDHAQEVKTEFEKAYPGVNSWYATGMDMTNFTPHARAFCKERWEMGAAPAYQYILTLEFPYDGGTMSHHGSELPFIFHNADIVGPSWKEGRTESFQDELFYSWVNFARNGDPNHDRLPVKWLPYSEEHHATMIFGDESVCRDDHDRDLIELMKKAAPPVTGRH
ncbi:MAG: carboxylesterase/lipase family protein [Eubacteriaceae bacterium]|nr:carboxylesterase/lipase family protein [Eubacteriaceae bacterium]